VLHELFEFLEAEPLNLEYSYTPEIMNALSYGAVNGIHHRAPFSFPMTFAFGRTFPSSFCMGVAHNTEVKEISEAYEVEKIKEQQEYNEMNTALMPAEEDFWVNWAMTQSIREMNGLDTTPAPRAPKRKANAITFSSDASACSSASSSSFSSTEASSVPAENAKPPAQEDTVEQRRQRVRDSWAKFQPKR
jgi:hypothetical protein